MHVSTVWSRVYFWGHVLSCVFSHVLYVLFCVFVVSICHVYSRIIGWWRWVIRFSCLNESQCKCWVKMFINCNYLNETKCCYWSPIIEWSWMQLYNGCNWIFWLCLMCNVLLKLMVVGLMFDVCILLKLNVNGLMM